jgi:hypothetical protein
MSKKILIRFLPLSGEGGSRFTVLNLKVASWRRNIIETYCSHLLNYLMVGGDEVSEKGLESMNYNRRTRMREG